jgi:prepilin-type N-terminal cleavage/methylation domain-containing protein
LGPLCGPDARGERGIAACFGEWERLRPGERADQIRSCRAQRRELLVPDHTRPHASACTLRNERGTLRAPRRLCVSDLAGLSPLIEGSGLARHPGVRHERGFTMIELAVVLAIVAVLAGMGFFVARAGRANANMASAAYELAIRLTGQRAEALADGLDRIVVVVDAPDNDARNCGTFNSVSCLRYFVLRNPTAAWTLNAFNPASPAVNAEILEQRTMPTGVRFHLPARSALAARPFQKVVILDLQLSGACGPSGLTCFAIRFTGDGDVRPVYPAAASPVKTGLALVLGSNATSETRAGETKGIVVGFPSGIVRTFPF